MQDPISMLTRPLWKETFAGAISLGSVTENHDFETAIIGAGITGLSTALHLARAGQSVALLEMGAIGGRASGRNGGQIVPGLKPSPSALRRRFGDETANKMLRLTLDGPSLLFHLIDEYHIRCAATHNGWVQAAFSADSLSIVKARYAELSAFGDDVSLLDRGEMVKATGSSFWLGGLRQNRAGAVQPFALVHGLAKAVLKEGVTLFEHSAVEEIVPRSTGTGGVLTVNGHHISAKNIVIATDSYTDGLWPTISQSYVTVCSAQMATDPLTEELRRQIIPEQLGISETRKITYYCRIDPEGRFVIGGRGKTPDRVDAAVLRQLRTAAEARFPALQHVTWPYQWACRVGMTLDDLPHLENPAPGIWTSYGYCGRGMAMGTVMGTVLAKAVCGVPLEALDYPVTPAARLPFYPLRQIGASLLINWYRLREAVGYPV